MAFKPALPEEQKKRAAHLKVQGWATADVAKDTGLLDATINANWRSWAKRYGIELPAAIPDRPQPAGTANLVTSYKVDPVTGERLTEPVTETVELSTKSMPSDFPAAPIEEQQAAQQTKKPAEKAAAASKPAERYSPLELLFDINRLFWAQISSGGLDADEYCYQAEIADGVLSFSFTLPVKGGCDHGQDQ